eukprot:1158953-Pelagomonas_calceolata.AAC.6
MLRSALSGSATHRQQHAPTVGPSAWSSSSSAAVQQAEQQCRSIKGRSAQLPHQFLHSRSASRCPPLRSAAPSFAFTGTSTGVLPAPVVEEKQMPVPLTWPGFKETIPGFKVVIAGRVLASGGDRKVGRFHPSRKTIPNEIFGVSACE